ncbi:MAG: iduronate 2-sulfatase [Humisphaera sp.]|nr:iduronate 2-sulfatase [Humisphaera sp.]
MMRLIVAVFAVALLLAADTLAAEKMNVLFIAVDDLRPAELGCYGSPHVKSPNIDALAKGGITFNRAYCQQAVCSPSRTSLMTGRRPDTTKIFDLETHFRDTIPDVVTLAQHFKNNGYHAQGFGKIYHGSLNDERSWSVPHTSPSGAAYGDPQIARDIQRRREELTKKGITGRELNRRMKGPAWEAADVEDEKLPDGSTTAGAIKALGEVKDKPFFLAVGFLKPHLPFVAPKKYFDLYPPADQIELPENRTAPQNAPEFATTTFGELRGYAGMPKGDEPVSDQQARELIRAYRACVSYTDAQIGKVLAELDRLKLRDNTIVILWGDHGWHLMEQGQWCKHTNFENATRAPLILSIPGHKNAGAKTDAFVEFVDIYPTLCDTAGLSKPDGLEGVSFLPLLDDPKRPWKSAAFSQYPRGQKAMGYSMRTDRYRYTEWQARDDSKQVLARELYDHQADPGETKNVAVEPNRAQTVKELSEQLRRGWRGALPPSK